MPAKTGKVLRVPVHGFAKRVDDAVDRATAILRTRDAARPKDTSPAPPGEAAFGQGQGTPTGRRLNVPRSPQANGKDTFMTLDPRALLVLLIATCLGVLLMGAAHANDAGGATRTPSKGHFASAGNQIPKPIVNHDQRSLTYA
jgi:hypothetical protein